MRCLPFCNLEGTYGIATPSLDLLYLFKIFGLNVWGSCDQSGAQWSECIGLPPHWSEQVLWKSIVLKTSAAFKMGL